MMAQGDAASRGAMLLDRIEIVADEREERALLDRLAKRDGPLTLAFANAHSFNLVWQSPEACRAFMAADILLRDGVGLQLHYRMAGKDAGLNMNGTDFIPKVLDACRGQKIALFGTANPWLGRAAAALARSGHVVCAQREGFEGAEAYAASLAREPAEVVVLAMGMPRQEAIAALIHQRFEHAPGPLVICGGAILDFLAERHPRAPLWVRKVRLEWLFRLSREPFRLFGRYVIGNARFLWRSRIVRRKSSEPQQ